MFSHAYKYRLMLSLKNRAMIFWTLGFPLIMSIFFVAAFSQIGANDTIPDDFKGIPVGIVEQSESAENQTFTAAIKEAQTNQQALFKVKRLSADKAQKALIKGDILGFYTLTEHDITLHVSTEDYKTSFLATFLSQYKQIAYQVNDIAKEKPQALSAALVKKLASSTNFIAESDTKSAEFLSFAIFTLIGMACMFGFHWGITTTSETRADKSKVGIRLCLSPVNKIKTVCANFLAVLTVFLTEMAIFLGFIYGVLKIDLGDRWPWILLTCLMGSITAIAMGMFFVNILRKIPAESVRSIGISFQMIFSFLAGMMSSDIKYYIDQHLPILAKINPVNLVSDSLTKLFAFTNISGVYTNYICLIGLAVIFLSVSIVLERSEQYAHL